MFGIALIYVLFLTEQIVSIPFWKEQKIECNNYYACHPLVKGKINVHLVPHSHDDVGWLKTPEQYYYGARNSIQNAGVQYIINSTVKALKENSDRRFIQVETAFFWKWWQHQSDNVRKDFIDLVNEGRLEIINGAWSMNDEANSNYQSTIDQFTWGLRLINDTIGKCGRPKFGWQIDPFGHSREHVSILSQLGFQGLVIGRLDYRDKERRYKDAAMDFLWKGSANLDNSVIFGSMFGDFYNSWANFCWDVVACSDDPVIDDPNSPDYNVEKLMKLFEAKVNDYIKGFSTNNLLVPMGGDFQYQAAEINFVNMEKLIKAFANHERLNVFFSTPSCYIKAVHDEIKSKGKNLELKTDDFFPYASNPHGFWSGYFTSRPNSKRFERVGNNILQGVKQLVSLARIVSNKDHEDSLTLLREVMGTMQHHDAITGTEKQHVANNYVRELTDAIKKAEEPLQSIIIDLLKKNNGTRFSLDLKSCLLSNVSICKSSENDSLVIAVYNPLSHSVTHYVRVPVPGSKYTVTGPDGEEVSDVLDTTLSFKYITNVTIHPKELVFQAKNIPPLGLKLYHLEKVANTDSEIIKDDNSLVFGTDKTRFQIDSKTKKISSITMNGVTVDIDQEFLYYRSFSGNNSKFEYQASGAYIFRPNATTATPYTTNIKITTQKGNLVDEVTQIINDEISQIIRVYKGGDDNFIEFDWLVGNLQVDKGGKEIITRYTVKNLKNNGVFYTDSNYREMIKRVLNKRNDYTYNATEEPIASNYYPITSRITIKDENQGLELAILNDRPQGGSSLTDGSIELMVHRRLLVDDNFGVNEALNEEEFGKGVYVRGQHHLTIGPTKTKLTTPLKVQQRKLALRKLLSPLVLIASTTKAKEDLQSHLNFQYSALNETLPQNVHLLTFEPWKENSFILRLEHIFEKNEDVNLSKNVTVSLKNLFRDLTIKEIRETTLAANHWLEDYEKEDKLVWTTTSSSSNTKKIIGDSLSIELTPMQIRTFIIKLSNSTDPGNNSMATAKQPTVLFASLFIFVLMLLQIN